MLIHPQPTSLTSAAAKIPTIRGPVHIRFENNPGQSFHLEIHLPANTSARVILPRVNASDRTVLLDGKPTAAVIDGQHLVLDPIGSGRRTFQQG